MTSLKDGPKWDAAKLKELESHKRRGTWELVDRPKGIKALGCKWVLSEKSLPDGSVKRKARLVAQGHRQ